MEESERQKIAAEAIAFELARLRMKADANGLSLLAHLIDMALAEARQLGLKG